MKPCNASNPGRFWLLLPGIFLLLTTSAADAREYREAARVQRVSAEDVLQLLIDGDGPVVVDARVAPQRARTGHIPGTMNVSVKEIYGWVPDLEKYRDRGIVFYCNDGLVSDRAARKLVREGFRKVFVMRGSLRRWKRLGYPLEGAASQ